MIFNCSPSEFKKISEFTVTTQIENTPTGEFLVTDSLKIKGYQGVSASVVDDTVLLGIEPTSFPDELVGGSGLPVVTEADNGKIPMVVDGEWEIVKFPAGEQSEVWNVVATSSLWRLTEDIDGAYIYEQWVSVSEKDMTDCRLEVALAASSTASQIAEARRTGVYSSDDCDGLSIRLITSIDDFPSCDLWFTVKVIKPHTLSYSVDEESMTLTIVEEGKDE